MACLGKAADIHQYNEALRLCYSSDEMYTLMFGVQPFTPSSAIVTTSPLPPPPPLPSPADSPTAASVLPPTTALVAPPPSIAVLPMPMASVRPNSVSYELLIDALLLEDQPEKAEAVLRAQRYPTSPWPTMDPKNKTWGGSVNPPKPLHWLEERVATFINESSGMQGQGEGPGEGPGEGVEGGGGAAVAPSFQDTWDGKRLAVVENWLAHAAHPVAKPHFAAEAGALSLVWQLHARGKASPSLYEIAIDFLGKEAAKHQTQFKPVEKTRRWQPPDMRSRMLAGGTGTPSGDTACARVHVCIHTRRHSPEMVISFSLSLSLSLFCTNV